ILRCLEHDPERRPPSALAVAAALPGGDPLAAAIAAGETPSPEMVAAAGGERGLTTRAAAALLVTAIASLVILPFLSQWSGAALPMTIEHGPQVMKAKAREVLERLGYSEDPVDTAWGYFSMSGWLDHIEDSVEARDRWTHLEDREHPLFGFWYRESPALLVNTRYFTGVAGGVVSYSSPYPRRTDEARITIDDRGRLWSLSAVPPQVSTEEPGESPAIDPFERLLTEAGLETQDLRPVKPEWNPPFFADRRKAWITELEPGLEMRVEAAAYGDRPVYLARIFPWSEPLRMRSSSASLSQTVVNAIQIAIFLLVLLGAVLMARRNIRKGRGDPSGAFRLAVFVGLSVMVLWVLNADHVPSFSEFGLLVIALSWSLFFGFIFWIVYVALEPYIRRRWPDMLISWSRLASGQFRDPLVGRDLLVGGAAAILISIAIPHFIYFGHRLLGNPLPQPRLFGLPLVEGPFSAVVTILSQIPGAIAASFFVTFLLFVFLVLFKREWLAAASAILLGSAVSTLSSGGDWLAAILFTAVWTAIVLILVRFGMLAAIITIFTTNATGLASTVPGGFSSLTTWPILISLGTALIIVVVGFVFATQGRSLFPPDFLES
ncbi:MAG: hypothetical protein R3338_11260, partial [Thermoanaerobaculia bacterium]|nr:hypothetical protein [Thermoanaerobaculia bacterium]